MDNDLPPLPDPMAVVRDTDDSPDGGGWIVDCECDGPLSYSLSPNEALFTAYQMRAYAALAVTAEREKCVSIIETHQVPVGNSAAGEMAAEWTMNALREIRDAITARALRSLLEAQHQTRNYSPM